ncbi:hypothetical protein [Caudoviricetes sp.]|nr:hypothetical protein [Caudoviricetes sp.]UOF79162.1 hypothetical protein [Caudoviricetes sp.]
MRNVLHNALRQVNKIIALCNAANALFFLDFVHPNVVTIRSKL